MATQAIEIKNKVLLLIGIILLVIGVVLSLYKQDTAYPHQSVGIVLVVAGIVFMIVGFLYSPQYLITAFQRRRAQA